MPRVQFSCPACDKPLAVADPDLAGRRIKCPACKEPVTVPGDTPAAPVFDAPPSDVERPKAARAPASRSARDRRDDSDREPRRPRRSDDDRAPRRRAKEATGGVAWVIVPCAVLGVLVLTGVGLFFLTDVFGEAAPAPVVRNPLPPVGPNPPAPAPVEPPDELPPPRLVVADPAGEPVPPVRGDTPEQLAARLTDADPEKRSAAAKALAALGPAAHPALPKLVAALDDEAVEVRDEAASAVVAVGRAKSAVLVDFSASWCGPCRQVKPIVDKLQAEGLPIMTVDVDEHPGLSTQFKIRVVPTFVTIRDDKEADRDTGALSEESLREMLKGMAKPGAVGGKLSLEGTAAQARVMALLLTLSGEDEWLRFLSAEEVRRQGEPAWPVFAAVAEGKYPDRLRVGALMAVAAAGGKGTVPAAAAKLLKARLADEKESTDLRGHAAVALRELKVDDPGVVPALKAALAKGVRPALRAMAAEQLGELQSAEAVPALSDALKDESIPLRRASAKALGMIGAKSGRAVPALIAAYESDGDNAIRDAVKSALSLIVPSAPEAAAAIVKALPSKDERTRLLALELLDAVGEPQSAAEPLRALLADDTSAVRTRAAVALQRIGQDDAKVLRVLAESFKGEEEDFAATEALRGAGRKAVPLLMECLNDPKFTPQQRLRATRLLMWSDRPVKKPPAGLTEALASKLPDVATCAALVLSRHTPNDPALVKPLAAGLASTVPELRRECAVALGAIKAVAAVPDLLAVVKKDEELRGAVGYALSQTPLDEKSVAELAAMLKARATRTAAANALANLKEHHATALPALMQAFQVAKEEEKYALGDTLRSFGKAAMPPLLELAADPKAKEEARLEALAVLGHMGPEAKDIAPELDALLKDANERVRTRAAIALAHVAANADVVDLLLKAVETGDEEGLLGDEARDALSVLGMKAAAGVDRLIAWMKAGDANRRTRNLHVLSRIGRDSEKAIALAVALLKTAEEENVRRSARHAMSEFGEKAVPELAKALADPAYSRRDVIAALQDFGERAKAARDPLTALLADKDRAVGVDAALALASIDPTVETAVPLLIEGAQSKDEAVRGQAINALGRYGPRAKPAVSLLVRALDSRETRGSAMYALGRLGPDAAEAVDTLVRLLDTRDAASAANALGAIGAPAAPAVPRLLKMLRNERTMNSAANALGRIGGEAKQAVPILVARLSDADAVSRTCVALQSVGKLDIDAALPALRKVIAGTDVDARTAAIWALGQLKSAQVVDDLLAAAKDAEPDVRRSAVNALGQLGPDAAAAVGFLTDTLQSKDVEMRHAAAGALGGMGPKAKAAVPALVKALDDKETQSSAAYALGRLGAADAVPASWN